MEPFGPQDPVYKLLGRARQAEPRPNFVQNVLRAVRQLPPRMTLRERLADWLGSLGVPRLALAGAAAVALAAAWLAVQPSRKGADPTPAPEIATAVDPASAATAGTPEADVAATLSDMDQLSTLLAVTDTRTFTDTEVAFLLY